jgi:catechol 2,3-dioxygenase-like lactoylglutathione lyase family enzyme
MRPAPRGAARPYRDRVSDADIARLAGILIWTDAARFPGMRRFYVELLGLRPRSDRDGFVNFAWGDQRLTIAVHDDVAGPARDPLRVMLNLRVDDIAAVHRRLRGAGVAFSRPPEAEAWGGRVATFADPDGNTLQLMQLPA